MFELTNTIRDYHWGSARQISDLLGLGEETSPQAELWLGAHPGCPSRLAGDGTGLDELIASDPQRLLGAGLAARYGTLPFLFKVLSAAQPLSIQVHPTLEQARLRFARENAAGTPLDAPERNYRDPNHKPEMLYALTDFVALSGFRQPAQIIADLVRLRAGAPANAEPVLGRLLDTLRGEDPLASALALVLEGDAQLPATVTALCAAITNDPELSGTAQFAEMARINEIYPGDPGVLVALLLNLVFLEPGQAISLAAGNVHAYLRGLGVEVMANSDNVLRGGLTSKHIDVAELLDVTVAEPAPAPLLTPVALADASRLYQPDFDEFQLQVIDGAAAGSCHPLQLHGAGVLLCTAGEFTVRSGQGSARLRRGQSLFLGADELPATAVMDAPGQLFAASAQRG